MILLGILNITPDSFSDGGKFISPELAIKHGLELLRQGADMLDIGGVSTAPGAKLVNTQEELDRVLPVISGLVKHGVTNISIDTSNSLVAREAIKLGATWINDQSAGLRDPDMPSVMCLAERVIIMHYRGNNSGVQAGEEIIYEDLLGEITNFFLARITSLTQSGVARDKIILDPGIGFGKGLSDSLKIISHMHTWKNLDNTSYKTLIGLSRKSFLGKILDIPQPEDRDMATLGANLAAMISGADIIRTHNIRATYEAIRVFKACMGDGERERT